MYNESMQPDQPIEIKPTEQPKATTVAPIGAIESAPLDTMPEQPPVDQRHKKSRWKRYLSYLIVIAILTGLFIQKQNIMDWWGLRNYTPTVAATQLATNTSMTNLGRKIFYLQKPQVQGKEAFYISCEEGETSVVLGCFKPAEGIFLLKVDDARLAGVEEVTAAHEMLHAAYARLGFQEKKRVTDMINAAYSKVTDQDIKGKIKLYQDNKADVTNELHSILATEVSSLPSDLEQYYTKYFSNRSAIVTYAAGYKNEFKKRKDRVAELDNQLKNIEESIAANNAQLDTQQAAINNESKRLDDLRNQGLIDEYNAGVATYNKSLIPFRSLIAETKGLVSEYKSVLTERNKVANEAQELNKALDSRIGTTVEDI